MIINKHYSFSIFFLFFCLVIHSCNSQHNNTLEEVTSKINTNNQDPSQVGEYISNYKEDSLPSESVGSVSSGKLINGKLMPFSGSNFFYFDTISYLNNRGFTNLKVRNTVVDTYIQLQKEVPNRNFVLMECSNKEGEKMFPHRTHQNGLSVDFMMPLLKDNKPYYKLDSIGASHYWLEFDDDGKLIKDKSVGVDFNIVAQHILLLEEQARLNGLKIKKIIIKTEFKDELFNTEFGKQLQNSSIYIVQSLTPLINSIHDDHYHIDFEIL